MPIRFRCQCGQKLRVGDDKVGQRAKCPRCKSFVSVPDRSEPGDEPVTTEPVRTESPSVQPLTDPGASGQIPVSHDSTPEPDGETNTPMIRVSELTESISVAPKLTGNPVEAEPPAGALPDSAWEPVAASISAASPPLASNPVHALPEIVIRDDSTDWVPDSDVPPLRTETVIDYDKVAVPRRVLYLQGILLGVVALVSFVLGMLMSDRTPREEGANRTLQACTLSGQVTYGGDGQPRPDDGSVVIVFPTDRRPAGDVRMAIEGLRPGDPVPNNDNISVRTIRGLGGDYARTNENGEYRLRLPSGRYHLLVISRRSTRSSTEMLEMTDVAQIGRYFGSVTELLNNRKYQWRVVSLQRNETLDTIF